MTFFKNYIREHYIIFLISLALWLCGVFLGMYIAFTAKADMAESLCEYIKSAVGENRGYFDTLKNGVATNFKYTLFLSISSLFLISLPVSAFLIGFKGFASGFASSFLIRQYGLEGIAVSLTTVVVPMFFSLPVYFMMFVSSLYFPLYTFKMRKQILSGERWSLNASFVAKMFILLLCLCAITAVEAFLSPFFLSVLGKG